MRYIGEEAGRGQNITVEHLSDGRTAYYFKYKVNPLDGFSRLDKPLFHSERVEMPADPNGFKAHDPDAFELLDEDAYWELPDDERELYDEEYDWFLKYETDADLFEAYWDWWGRYTKACDWLSYHWPIVKALYAALMGEPTPERFTPRRQKECNADAKRRLAAILPASKSNGKAGMTIQAAAPYLKEPEKMTAEQVQAVIDATGVTLEFLRGQVLRPTETVSFGTAEGLAAVYETLNERHKAMLWGVAMELEQNERHA